MGREDAPSLASEIPGPPLHVAELEHKREHENDRYESVLSALDQLGQAILSWDGTPEHLQDVAAQFCQVLGCRALAFSFFEAEHLCRSITEPLNAHIPFELTQEHVDRVFQERQPVSNDDARVLYVPLCSAAERLGLIEVLFDRVPTPADMLIWHSLGPQFALTLTNRTLHARAERAHQREQLLHDVIKHITSDIDLDKMLAKVLKLTIPMAGADDGSIVLLDDQRRVVHHIFQQGDLCPRTDRVVQEAISFGLAGWMIEHQQGTVVRDTVSDDRWIKLEAKGTVRSAVGVPLVRGDVTRGLLLLVHHEPDHFDEQDLDFLTSVADQATIVVENAYLLALTQQRVKELALINEIGQATSSLHLNDVLRIVTQRVVKALQVRRCAVFLLDESKTQVVLCAVNNPDLLNDNMNVVVSLTDRPHVAGAIKTRRPIEIKNVFADERLRHFWDKARDLDVKMQLAVPLMTQQQVIGAISIDRGESDPAFSGSDLDLMMTIAHQAANAISNARLYQEAQSRAEQLWLANRVSHDIGTQLDINQLVWEVVRLIRETFDCYYVAVGLIEGQDLVFRSGISYLYQTTPKLSLSLEGDEPSIAGWAARRGRSVLVRDVREDPRYRPRPGLEELRSQLSVPLKVRDRARRDTEAPDQTIGVLDVGSIQIGAFSEGDQQLLESLAAQISVAIENARLFGRVQEERARLEAILNGTDDAIIITDVSDHVLFLNPAAQLAFGNGDTLFPGCPLSKAVGNQELWAFWQQAVGDEAHSAEITLPDGRTLHASITPVSGVGKVAVMQDITYLKELDEIKSDFVSTVSHDLRSPLQVIQGSAELIPRVGSVNQEQRRQVEHILAIVRRISDLVQNLLDIGRIEAGVGMDIELCALDEIIARSAGACRSLARDKSLEFSVELPRTLPLVSGNPLRLDQMITNLVTNAIKFTPEGSVTVAADSTDDWVTIEVRDTGIGIPAEAQDKLFEKFYRVQSPDTRGIQGTGLGLAIVKSIVESHGGTIEVESFPNLGSTFIVRLPICAEPLPH